MERWRMRLVVATIPLFLHISLFLFLAGLWLRLRDINKQLGLIVGISSLIIASSYVVVTLLPIFTNAPFSTSASELMGPVVNGIRRIFQFRRYVRPPRLFAWTASLFPTKSSSPAPFPFALSPYIPRLRLRQLSTFFENVYKEVGLYAHNAWKIIALLPIFPTFAFVQNPFNELNKLKVGETKRDKRIHLRALFWLMNTPLSKDEVKEILKEFKTRSDDEGEPLDRTMIKLLVLSLSSILDNNDISNDERPIFDHCTKVLADEMGRAFENGEHNRRIHVRNTKILEKLEPHFQLKPGEDYWSKAIPALWLCPTKTTIHSVIRKLDSNQPTLEEIPDFSIWDWDNNSSNKSPDKALSPDKGPDEALSPDQDLNKVLSSNSGLDKALSSFLQDIFAILLNTRLRIETPTTIPSLIVDCLRLLDHHLPSDRPLNGHPIDNHPLDNHPEYTLKLHTALCFFAAVMGRSDPQVFAKSPSLTDAFLESTKNYYQECGDDEQERKRKRYLPLDSVQSRMGQSPHLQGNHVL